MKTTLLLLLVSLAAAISTPAIAADKIVAGPKGGRLLASTPHAAEFFVTKDRRVEITFYDSARRPVAPTGQAVAITAEPKSGRTPVALVKTATGFVAEAPLPASAEPYRVVVQIREKAEARPQNFRIDLNLDTCGGCSHAEYACTCAH